VLGLPTASATSPEVVDGQERELAIVRRDPVERERRFASPS
jgi:hypothetical protein